MLKILKALPFSLFILLISCNNGESEKIKGPFSNRSIVTKSITLEPIKYNDEIVRNMDHCIDYMHSTLNASVALLKKYAKELPIEEELAEYEKNKRINLKWLNLRLTNLEELKEIDPDVKYKATVANSFKKFINLSNNQLSKIPKLLTKDINEENMVKATNIIIDTWTTLVEEEKFCQNKCWEFADKHQFKLNGKSKVWDKEFLEIKQAKEQYKQLVKLYKEKYD